MSIVLIIPPNPFLLEEKRNCPLGILYVAATLEKAGLPVQVVDLREQGNWATNGVIPEAESYGLTATSIDFPYARQVAQFLKTRDPRCRVVIGGPHATVAPETCSDFDTVVVGEGEAVSPTCFSSSLHIFIAPRVTDLDTLLYPARHLLPRESVVSTTLCHQRALATTIIATRGCPFRCTYCASPRIWGRMVIKRSPRNVIAEVEELVANYGVEELRFQDDELNLNKDWLEGLSPLRKLVRFRCNARAELGNWAELKVAGCYEVGIGVETANPPAHQIHKRVELEATAQGIWQAYNAGLGIRLFFILGLPFDDGEVAERTIAFIESMPPLVGVHLNLFSPFPGSAIGDKPDRFNLIIIKPPVSILPQGENTHFTYRLGGQDMDKLLEQYHFLQKYIKEQNLGLS